MRLASLLLLLTACGRLGFSQSEPTTDAAPDAPPVDARCDPLATADTVALYSFEAGLSDTTAAHDAIAVGAVATIEGACGTSAARFDAGSHLLVPDAPAFDLAEGSIEFFARVPMPATGVVQGLVSRDANNTDFDGHISIGIAATGELFARLQRATGLTVFRCSAAPIATDQWTHVAASFGPQGLRMWLDGVEANGTSVVYEETARDCTAPHTFGIDGNDNTLVIGAFNHRAPNNAPMPAVTYPLVGAIDQLRIRSAWRDYSRSR